MVEYRYDAWGEPTSTSGTLKTSLGILNPFRYRGYVYDKETGLYFLWSRYYYPDKARFVNVDSIVGKLGDGQPSNMYAYCDGMPIIKSDPDGHASQTALLLGGAILVVAVVAAVKIQSATKAAEKVNTAAGKKVITNKQIMKAAFNPVPESAMKEIRRRAEGWYFGEKILFSYTEQPNQYVIYDLTPRGSVVRWDHSYVEYSLNREEPLYKFLDFLVEVFEDPTFSIPGLSEWQNFGFGQLISAYASVRDITLPPTLNVSKTVIAESEGDSAYRKGFEGLY